jgi:hypothetical protein
MHVRYAMMTQRAVAGSGWQWQVVILSGVGGRVANAMHPSSWHGNIVSLHSIEQTPTSLTHPTTYATSLGVPYVSSQSDSDPSPWPGRWRGLAVALIPATRAASTALSPDHGSISPGILRHQSPRPPLGIGPPARPPPVECHQQSVRKGRASPATGEGLRVYCTLPGGGVGVRLPCAPASTDVSAPT